MIPTIQSYITPLYNTMVRYVITIKYVMCDLSLSILTAIFQVDLG